MDTNILALCDEEEEYAQLMTEFIKKKKNLPWELHTYTSSAQFIREEKDEIAVLVVAESTYTEEMRKRNPKCIVILNESGVRKWEECYQVNKYQQAELVLKTILEAYAEYAEDGHPRLKTDCKTKFIGIYSPVRRCLQTSFALTLSQMLAQEHTALYMNFEHYAGITELLPDMQTRDMADLLYFLTAQKEKFYLRLRTIIQKKSYLDYIPPMKSGQNLLSVTLQEWLKLLQMIEECGEYEYVILDLSESMQGLFEILRICTKVFTLTREDRISQSKLLQYEQILSLYEYKDILDKTNKLNLPHIRKLPEDLEQYTRGDLAEYVRGILRELKEEVKPADGIHGA